MRRSSFSSAIVATAVMVLIAGCSASGHAPADVPSSSGATHRMASSAAVSQSSTPGGSARPHTGGGAGYVPGKYAAGGIVMHASGAGLVHLSGYPDESDRIHSWQETTRDGGRHWAAPSAAGIGAERADAQRDMVFVTAQEGWTYGPNLYYTDDGGRQWSHERSHIGEVDDLTVQGRSTWMLASAACTASTCPDRVYRTTRVGGHLQPTATQPAAPGSLTSLAALTPHRAVSLLTVNHHTTRLAVTTNNGTSWTVRHTPCAHPSLTPSLIRAGSQGAWLACAQVDYEGCGCLNNTALYRTRDLGRTWVRLTNSHAESQLVDLVDLVASNGRVAWAITQAPEAQTGTVWRTIDGGHTWHAALTGSTRHPLATDSITVHGPRRAWLIDGADGGYNTHPATMRTTTDGGRTWMTHRLPAPRGL